MTITITRTDFSVEELRREASRARDASQARRLLALALILEGASRSDAVRDTRYQWAYLFGAVCPARKLGAWLGCQEPYRLAVKTLKLLK